MTITIYCDKCNKPVSQCTTTYDRHTDEYQYIVSCHSQFDRCRMPAKLFRDGWYITEARAFKSTDTTPKQEDFTVHSPTFPIEIPLLSGSPSDITPVIKDKFTDGRTVDDWAPLLKDAI